MVLGEILAHSGETRPYIYSTLSHHVLFSTHTSDDDNTSKILSSISLSCLLFLALSRINSFPLDLKTTCRYWWAIACKAWFLSDPLQCKFFWHYPNFTSCHEIDWNTAHFTLNSNQSINNLHPLWTPQNMTLTPFTTKLKTLGPTRNIYL
jgi:hypothetical protein